MKEDLNTKMSKLQGRFLGKIQEIKRIHKEKCPICDIGG